MDLQEVMQQNVFVVVGDTLNEDKYACKIKNRLLENGYTAYGVGKEFSSINELGEEIDIIDLCINPVKGLKLISECEKPFKCVVIQPGAESAELISYLKGKELPYIEGCLLVGLNLYSKK
ncbi:MAG: CoA-binding protein [Oscillospiraceae bacterium]|nr:CoA-binding protein [Oscillospiraceae bacterium]